jgi:hypothetical protein
MEALLLLMPLLNCATPMITLRIFFSEYDGTSLDSFLEEHPQDEKISILYKKESISETAKIHIEHDMIKSQSNKEESSSQGNPVKQDNSPSKVKIKY